MARIRRIAPTSSFGALVHGLEHCKTPRWRFRAFVAALVCCLSAPRGPGVECWTNWAGALARRRRCTAAFCNTVGRAATAPAAAADFLPGSIAEHYAPLALHKELFDSSRVDDWVRPDLREALSASIQAGDAGLLDVASLPEVRVEAPGVISFACLEADFCQRVLDEVRHYAESGLPNLAPNSMNRYGIILNDIGMRPTLSVLFRRYMKLIGARLFGDDAVRALELEGVALGSDDWGGSTLSDHHSFAVWYQSDKDRGLDMHVDECDVTFNIGLTGDGDFLGGDLAFCGMYGDEAFRQLHHTCKQEVGRCIVHAGKRRHGVRDVEAGERASLIMWTKSLVFRKTPAYRAKCEDFALGRRPLPQEGAPPDGVCLSLAHDSDYLRWSHRL